MKNENAYDLWAEQYDSNQNKTRDLDKKATIETLSKYNFSNVIELGCGTGKNSEFLLKKADAIIGLDFSQEMLNKAKAKIEDPRIEFRKADLTQDWSIEDNFADLITCSLVLEHIEDLDSVFNQANRKLKNDGHFFISEFHPFKQYIGSKARFENANGVHELECFVHHTSEYLTVATKNGFKLIELNEWFDEQSGEGAPRLIGLMLQKISIVE